MKTKLYKILGVALTLVLLASLTVGLTTVPTGAASSNLKFVKLELPQVEEYDAGFTAYSDPIDPDDFANSEGDFWCTPSVDLGPIAQTPDGEILFAAVAEDGYDTSNWYHILKSTDGGYSWTASGFYDRWLDMDPGTAGNQTDGSPIVDIVSSPEYVDDTTLAVATEDYVYISEDAGKNFTVLANPWLGIINDMDMTIAEDGDLSLMVATSDPEVFVTSGLLAWTAQDIPGSFPAAVDLDVLACAFLPTFADDGDIGISAIVTDIGALPADWTDGTTTMTFSFADISAGGEWGDAITNAPFVNADMSPFDSEWACIAFPDDFDGFGTGNNVCFVGIVQTGDLGATSCDVTPIPSGSDAYKVILKEGGSSQAVDLDVRGVLTTLAPTATAIVSIDVCGEAEEATILVGTDAINLGDAPEYFSTYLSEDSGDNWAASMKCPTGGTGASEIEFSDVRTRVLMAPDFCDSGMAYASTQGVYTDAFQRTTDANASWNQISIIDYGLDNDNGSATGVVPGYWVPTPGFDTYGYADDGTLWMITQNCDDTSTVGDTSDDTTYLGVLWARLDGKNWERILSYATPGVTDNLVRLTFLGDGSAFFAADQTSDSIWRSTDQGATWLKKISAKTPLTTVAAVSATTIYTGTANGEIWWSTRSGTGWEKPEDTEIPGSAEVIGISVNGDLVVVSTTAGNGFISSDGGETVEKIGSDNPFAGGPTIVTTDLGFDPSSGGFLYAVSPAPVGTVMRCEVDLSNPGDAEWVQIDAFQDSTNSIGNTDDYYPDTTFDAGGPALAFPPSGILYVADQSAVNKNYTTAPIDNAGGLWRSTNPTADTDSTTPPYFERENKNLNVDDCVGFLAPSLAPPSLAPTLFFSVRNYGAGGNPATDPSVTPYYEQIVLFTDILNVGVTPVTPEADATGVGLLPENLMGDVYPVVTFGWEEMAGATNYQFEIAIDPDFDTTLPLNNYNGGFTDALGVIIDDLLLANSTYYWHVRVAAAGSLIGSPLISPWSETYKFKTAIGPTMQRPALQAPAAGEGGVTLSPTFEWSGIEWAEDYEYELALDPTTTAGGYFTEPLVALVGADALVSTAWKCDIQLDYSTRYYWHVKALGIDTDTPWSDVGTFTTMDKAPPPTTEAPPVTIPPAQEITPAWIWAVVIIGAILVIAVIVLIVTTRRVP
jgi:hypothetical protein